MSGVEDVKYEGRKKEREKKRPKKTAAADRGSAQKAHFFSGRE
jgi:hypothetical protein